MITPACRTVGEHEAQRHVSVLNMQRAKKRDLLGKFCKVIDNKYAGLLIHTDP